MLRRIEPSTRNPLLDLLPEVGTANEVIRMVPVLVSRLEQIDKLGMGRHALSEQLMIEELIAWARLNEDSNE